MGVDWGERRIGIALSDPTHTLASPHETVVRRRGKRPPLAALERVARAHDVEGLVVGLPLTLSGEEDAWCEEVRRVGDELGRRLEIDVTYFDERMTSVEAERGIRSAGHGRSRREDKSRVDAAAAAVILQRYLDRSAR